MKLYYKYKCLNCGAPTIVEKYVSTMCNKKINFYTLAIEGLRGYMDHFNYEAHCCMNYNEIIEFNYIHKCNEDEYGLLHLIGVRSEE